MDNDNIIIGSISQIKVANYFNVVKNRNSWGPRIIGDFEFIYQVRGIGIYRNDGKECLKIGQNEILLIPPGVEHTFFCECTEAATISCIHFTMKTMTDIKQPAIFQAAEDDIILNLFKRCVEEYEAKKKHFDRLLEQYVNEIWIRLIRTPVKGQHKREPHKVAHAKAYMLSNYNKAIGRQDIAHHVDVTPEHLNYLFKTFCADTPMNFLTQLRIRKAKELLRRANLNVSQVAFFTGFTDPLYFSRVFRKYVGLSPRTFANQI